jgi:hypothetical protein
MVISKPKRTSVATGVSHFILVDLDFVSKLLVVGAVEKFTELTPFNFRPVSEPVWSVPSQIRHVTIFVADI